jgi:hypothetical protein
VDWKDYSGLNNTHAFLSPSRYHWINYDNEKLIETFRNYKRAALGTRLHALAAELISLARWQPQTAEAFNAFVNDAIGFGMKPEVLLYYSPRCYGTADAISYDNGVLRVHDLKTGITPVSPGATKQLLIYAALFCLDYVVDPLDLAGTHLRIYQNEEVIEFDPSPEELRRITQRIIDADLVLKEAEALVVL